MDTNTSGEELLTKARKPYTITKQRERWTEDEHDRFLEALKLYGRAWQRIEEHIGTKTAVQIRSHAQKFFTKLEKEAEAKGIPVCQALDIEIPPPRPKRKPNTPYPRKPGNNNNNNNNNGAKLTSSASSLHYNLDLEKTPLSEKTSTGKETQDDNCSGVSKKTILGNNRKVVSPSGDDNVDKNMVQEVEEKNKDNNHADIVNENIAKCSQFIHPPGMISPQDFMFRPMGDHRVHTQATSSTTTTTTTTSFPQDDYRSFLQISSTFSNLIVSTLLQNPPAHAAATYAAASVWPYPNSGDSSSSSSPSVAAIAAATVAAATAWWASHGLLLPPPPPTPITCLPIPTTISVPSPTMTQTGKEKEKQNTALQASKCPASSSSDDSEETGVTKIKASSDSKTEKVEEEVVDPQKKKLVDRSSCGSNTPSGSDAEEETDALDHKTVKDKEDIVMKETESVMELSNRRSGKLNNNNNNNNYNYNYNNQTTDSWKEVSEEGRIAFQALFARERLPQSFSPPLEAENFKQQSDNSMTMATTKIQDSCNATTDQGSVVVVTIGKSVNKTRQTGGFKPYKRCSMEAAKESGGGGGGGNTNNQIQNDEKVCKRLRLETIGEASTTTTT